MSGPVMHHVTDLEDSLLDSYSGDTQESNWTD